MYFSGWNKSPSVLIWSSRITPGALPVPSLSWRLPSALLLALIPILHPPTLRDKHLAPFLSQILVRSASGTYIWPLSFSILNGTWACMHECLCCAAAAVLRWVPQDEMADCSWMPLQRITLSGVTHFSFNMCCHGHLPSWGPLWIQSCLEGITGQCRSLSHSFIIIAKVPNPYLTGKLIWEKYSFRAFGALGLQV